MQKGYTIYAQIKAATKEFDETGNAGNINTLADTNYFTADEVKAIVETALQKSANKILEQTISQVLGEWTIHSQLSHSNKSQPKSSENTEETK